MAQVPVVVVGPAVVVVPPLVVMLVVVPPLVVVVTPPVVLVPVLAAVELVVAAAEVSADPPAPYVPAAATASPAGPVLQANVPQAMSAIAAIQVVFMVLPPRLEGFEPRQGAEPTSCPYAPRRARALSARGNQPLVPPPSLPERGSRRRPCRARALRCGAKVAS
jgi:hypothetical protein